MRQTVLCSALVWCLGVTPVFGQEDGGFSGGRGGSGLPSDINLPRTIPQQFSLKLKLDRAQQPEVDKILTAAAAEAAPSTQDMLLARQRLLNALRNGQADEAKTAEAAYAAAAAKGATVEADAMAKVYALLKPNQQKDAPAAFALIAGLFASSTGQRSGGPAAGRGGATGRGAPFPFSRFELLTQHFGLAGESKKAVKSAVDDHHKRAATVRDALLKMHADLGTAVVSANTAQIEQAARAYGAEAAAMAHLEMEALSQVIGIADPQVQHKDGVQAAFYLARGMFLRGKWDEIPNPNVPSY